MVEPKEIMLSLPANFVAKCPGLSFDIGGSVAKFVYRAKEDMEAYEKLADKSRNKLRLVSFSRADLEAGLEWLKARVQMTPPKEEGGLTPVYGTGLGTGPFGASLKEKLNIQVNTLMEFDCFVESHRYLYQYLPWFDIEYPMELSSDDKDYLANYMNKHMEKFESTAPTDQQVYPEAARTVRRRLFRHVLGNRVVPGEEDRPATPPPPPPEFPDIIEKYPALVATMGSAFAYLKVKLPGQNFQMMDVCNRGGKTFMSLGSLLLGVKNYNELIDMAEKGDYRNVTKYDETGDFNDVSSFALAKGKTVGDFKKEDLAAALLFQTVQDCVQNMVQLCAAYELRNVMLAGSFVTHPYVRRVINREWCRRLFQQAYLTDFTADVSMNVMQHGPYFGAIGCMINSVNPFRPM